MDMYPIGAYMHTHRHSFKIPYTVPPVIEPQHHAVPDMGQPHVYPQTPVSELPTMERDFL
jgi:hypothetical protein